MLNLSEPFFFFSFFVLDESTFSATVTTVWGIGTVETLNTITQFVLLLSRKTSEQFSSLKSFQQCWCKAVFDVSAC